MLRGVRRIWLLGLLTLLGGCGGSGPVTDGCAGWAAIRVTAADVLSEGTARQVLAHNLAGKARGCW